LRDVSCVTSFLGSAEALTFPATVVGTRSGGRDKKTEKRETISFSAPSRREESYPQGARPNGEKHGDGLHPHQTVREDEGTKVLPKGIMPTGA